MWTRSGCSAHGPGSQSGAELQLALDLSLSLRSLSSLGVDSPPGEWAWVPNSQGLALLGSRGGKRVL